MSMKILPISDLQKIVGVRRHSNLNSVTALGCSCILLSIVPSGCGVGISLHAVDQHSNWLASEAIECHIEFSQ